MAGTASSRSAGNDAGKTDDRAKAIGALDHDACPNCTVGTLRVVGYDPEASHEAQQGHTAVPFKPSGGAVHRHCFLCNYHESNPLTPSPDEDE